jgi:hypothetical protein
MENPEILKKATISDIHFRDKRNGWKVYTSTFQFENNAGQNRDSFLCVENGRENIFLKGFLSSLYVRPICYACPYRCLRSGSDITIGDFWGIENVLPAFDDNKGVSLVMVNTSHGKAIYQSIRADDIETSYADAIAVNYFNIEGTISRPKMREKFMHNLDNVEIIKLIIDCMTPSFIGYVFLFLKNILKKILSVTGLLYRIENKRDKKRWKKRKKLVS